MVSLSELALKTFFQASHTLFHWYYEFLHISKGPLDLGDFKWYTTYDKFWPFMVIILAWVLIGAFMCSGLWVKGKVTIFYPQFTLNYFQNLEILI